METHEFQKRYKAHSFSLEELLLMLGRQTSPKTLWWVGIRMGRFLNLDSIVRHVAAQLFCVCLLHVLPSDLPWFLLEMIFLCIFKENTIYCDIVPSWYFPFCMPFLYAFFVRLFCTPFLYAFFCTRISKKRILRSHLLGHLWIWFLLYKPLTSFKTI